GHLSKILCLNDSFVKRVIALDASTFVCDKARHNISKVQNAGIRVYNIRLDGSDELLNFLCSRIKDLEDELGQKIFAALVGLHCCGDLQPLILRLFARLDAAKIALTVGCCYHKMSSLSKEARKFNYFPLSDALSNVCREHELLPISKYSLRLASQDSKERWLAKSHSALIEHLKFVFFRNIIEKFKTEKADSFYDNQYGRMIDFHTNNEGAINRIASYSALQIPIGDIIEKIILWDRRAFAIESGCNCDVSQIFDSLLSPRNLLLYCSKS
uniref:Methyltransferase domain-containing protein n=1 Tax=Romanomermis culicivorax TaxID=13658 RepID=A0A915KJ57_ROMCU